MKFENLIETLSHVHQELKAQGIRAVNTALTLRNWCFGMYIVEFEQHGNDRALYGQGLLKEISTAMAAYRIPNTDERELRRYRQFYQIYPLLYYLFDTNPSIRGLLPPVFKSDQFIRRFRIKKSFIALQFLMSGMKSARIIPSILSFFLDYKLLDKRRSIKTSTIYL